MKLQTPDCSPVQNGNFLQLLQLKAPSCRKGNLGLVCWLIAAHRSVPNNLNETYPPCSAGRYPTRTARKPAGCYKCRNAGCLVVASCDTARRIPTVWRTPLLRACLVPCPMPLRPSLNGCLLIQTALVDVNSLYWLHCCKEHPQLWCVWESYLLANWSSLWH